MAKEKNHQHDDAKADKVAKPQAAKADKVAHDPVPVEEKPWVCVREIREDAGTWKAGAHYTGKRIDHLAKRNAIVQK